MNWYDEKKVEVEVKEGLYIYYNSKSVGSVRKQSSRHTHSFPWSSILSCSTAVT